MKKNNLCVLALSAFLLAGCSGGTNSSGSSTADDNSSTASSSVTGNTITVDPNTSNLDNFNTQYTPVKNSIQKRAGSIKICLDYGGTEDGWKALASEYSRLHSNQVTVTVSTATGTYSEYISVHKSELDIVQGNYVDQFEKKCIDFSNELKKENAYCGVDSNGAINKWRSILDVEAYETTSSSTSNVYILNSENIQTCWFINTIALAKAKEKGYTGSDSPTTWDEMMTLCSYMKEAGYAHPLGISLDNTSIDSNQFTWLLRVYGDYYYRSLYDKQSNHGIINNNNFTYDPTDTYPEGDEYYDYALSTIYNSILDDRAESEKSSTLIYPKYAGAKSDRFKEFISQLYKMRGYLSENPVADSQETLRGRFYNQSNSDAPQIMLDYLGEGLLFGNHEVDNKFKCDFFDYPKMNASEEFVPSGSIVRDVGGNGGYLSIYDNGSEKNALNLDFMKFVMSPYGQSVYYKALSADDFAPYGMTTIKKEAVSVPTKWRQFFETDKVSFSGQSDNNPFVQNFLRGLAYQTTATKSLRDELRTYLYNGASGETAAQKESNRESRTNTFSTNFNTASVKAWNEYCEANNLNKDSYLTPGRALS